MEPGYKRRGAPLPLVRALAEGGRSSTGGSTSGSGGAGLFSLEAVVRLVRNPVASASFFMVLGGLLGEVEDRALGLESSAAAPGFGALAPWEGLVTDGPWKRWVPHAVPVSKNRRNSAS